MSQARPSHARPLDDRAVENVLRRLARDGAAPWLHGEVARRMAQRLEWIRAKPQRIVEWWPSLGGSEDALAQAYPDAVRWKVEPTPAWQAVAAEQVQKPWWSPARWTRQPAPVMLHDEALPGDAQLVWANMMLHMATDPLALMARWHQALQVDGFVMFSCLGPDSLRELRSLYQRMGWGEPGAAFVDMHDLGDMLVQSGFADPVMDQEQLTLTWPDPGALLAELRQLGGNAALDRHAGLRTPRWRHKLENALASLADGEGRLRLTFEVSYGHAFKATPRVAASGVSTVSLDEMRDLLRAGRATG